jgi:hypothetical protein
MPVNDVPLTPLPPRRQGPIVMLFLMIGLFVVLAGILFKDYARWSNEPASSRRAASRAASAPASRPFSPQETIEPGLPEGAGFAARNVDFGGNLAPIAAKEGQPLAMDDAMFRVAVDVARMDPNKFGDRATRLPAVKDLLEHPTAYEGMAFTFRMVPAEVWDYANNVPDRVTSWRIYGTLQRNLGEFVVLETIEPPPTRDWTLYRDVIEVDALFLRTATYEARKDGAKKVVPYFVAKNYRRVVDDGEAVPARNFLDVVRSPYGPFVGVGVLVLVFLTAWTLRRHSRQTEKREREHFYAMLRSRKHNKPAAPRENPPADAGGARPA